MKSLARLACLGLLLAAASGSASAADKYVVGVSNTLIGNGWREEMICSIKAQAEASGMVSKVVVANRNVGSFAVPLAGHGGWCRPRTLAVR